MPHYDESQLKAALQGRSTGGSTPVDSDAVVEAMIQDKGLTAPRVMPKHIDALVASLTFQLQYFQGTTMTVAGAFLPNGFAVAVGTSACASPENYNKEVGDKIAIDNARDIAREKLWELEGYVLKKQLDLAKSPMAVAGGLNPDYNPNGLPPHQQRVFYEKRELDDKIDKLDAFMKTVTFVDLPINEHNRLTEQYGHMKAYSKTLGERIAAF